MLELRDISKVFAANGYAVPALSSVSATVHDREYIRLEGPNGSGKTTLLNVIAGFCQPDTGCVLFGGQDITDTPEHRRCFIGRVFQDAREASCDHLTVLQTLCLAQIGSRPSIHHMAVTSSRKDRALLALSEAGFAHLRERLHEPLIRLSGGERQVINVLFLKLREPPAALVLADEPTNHLDPDNAMKVLDLLTELATRSAVILVSHEERMERGIGRVWRLEKGQLVDDRVL